MILIGYHSTGAYKLYDPNKNKVVISRDVVIIEDEHWDWKAKKTSLTQIDPAILHDDSSVTEDSDSHDHQRPQRTRNPPARLNDYEIHPDDAVDDEGDLVHIALMADSEPLSEVEAMKHSVWKNAMTEEIRY